METLDCIGSGAVMASSQNPGEIEDINFDDWSGSLGK